MSCIIKGSRGGYVFKEPYLQIIKPLPDFEIRDIVKKEYELLKSGDFKTLKNWKIWENDEHLLLNYCKLFYELNSKIKEGSTNRTSRNNVVVNEKCCISGIQLFNDCLIVIQRSQDIRAKQGDYETISLIANELNAEQIYGIELIEHEYLDKSKIARRQN